MSSESAGRGRVRGQEGPLLRMFLHEHRPRGRGRARSGVAAAAIGRSRRAARRGRADGPGPRPFGLRPGRPSRNGRRHAGPGAGGHRRRVSPPGTGLGLAVGLFSPSPGPVAVARPSRSRFCPRTTSAPLPMENAPPEDEQPPKPPERKPRPPGPLPLEFVRGKAEVEVEFAGFQHNDSLMIERSYRFRSAAGKVYWVKAGDEARGACPFDGPAGEIHPPRDRQDRREAPSSRSRRSRPATTPSLSAGPTTTAQDAPHRPRDGRLRAAARGPAHRLR